MSTLHYDHCGCTTHDRCLEHALLAARADLADAVSTIDLRIITIWRTLTPDELARLHHLRQITSTALALAAEASAAYSELAHRIAGTIASRR